MHDNRQRLEKISERLCSYSGFVDFHFNYRALFDNLSAEWESMPMPEKLHYLNLMTERGITLQALLDAYRSFYADESYILQTLPESLADYVAFFLNDNRTETRGRGNQGSVGKIVSQGRAARAHDALLEKIKGL